ncbi:copper transporter [Sciscionella sediminilitoris]|uniref:copper transporter n=1 Tax=Sciscionella sediminilitoris TaxID=1445613 RepID=UPI0004DF70E0|nr:copper transporter [Sciscionella sp. SE31]
MISLRYHVISIAAVFLALALGVVLGSTTLSNTLLSGLSNQKDDLSARLSDEQAQNNVLRAKLDRADKFAAGVGPTAVKGVLDRRTVAIVSTPDASQRAKDAIGGLVKNAGGSVTAQLQLTKDFSDPSKSDQLRDLVTRVIPSGAQLPTASDPGTLSGGLLGSLLLLGKNNQPQANPQETSAAISALSDGGFVRASGDVKPAQLAIVLTGGAEKGDAAGDQASTVARFAAQLDKSGAGAVLGGGDGSAQGNGAVGVARADSAINSQLSTVDDTDLAQGQIATIFALAEQLNGQSGQYGTAGNAKAPLPGNAQG